MAKKNRTAKQQMLIDCYAGDIKEAAAKAEISYGYARQLLTRPNILESIRNRQDTEIRPKTIATRQERQAFWTKIQRDEDESTANRLRASELLGKSEADFIDVVKAENTMRLQLGAPRALLEGHATTDAVFEPTGDDSIVRIGSHLSTSGCQKRSPSEGKAPPMR